MNIWDAMDASAYACIQKVHSKSCKSAIDCILFLQKKQMLFFIAGVIQIFVGGMREKNFVKSNREFGMDTSVSRKNIECTSDCLAMHFFQSYQIDKQQHIVALFCTFL